MDSELLSYGLIAAAAFVAGVMNAVAGGGTFVTFPTLVFTGVPAVVANASNAVALFPASFASAWAYRHDFKNFEGVSFKAMAAVSLVGGVVGAALLLYTPEVTFNAIVPWLLLAATLIFAFGPKIVPKLRTLFRIGPFALLTIQFIVGIYGGYFGGAMGIVMLAVYSLFGLTDLNAMNATKALMAGLINGVSVVLFASAGKVVWPQTITMIVAAMLGGYFGARVARGMNPAHVRAGIIAISVTVTIVFFLRQVF
ncbi:MAG: sulfite exporter TauE/SafE family protein [Rhodospirillaceae bacterium]|nr:sulfite exporter TauE/SafE family protein [Rhodospirillaceae bacterium]